MGVTGQEMSQKENEKLHSHALYLRNSLVYDHLIVIFGTIV